MTLFPWGDFLKATGFLGWLVGALRGCGYWLESTEAVLVETLYFAEESGIDLAEAAARLLALLDAMEALRDASPRSPWLGAPVAHRAGRGALRPSWTLGSGSQSTAWALTLTLQDNYNTYHPLAGFTR